MASHVIVTFLVQCSEGSEEQTGYPKKNPKSYSALCLIGFSAEASKNMIAKGGGELTVCHPGWMTYLFYPSVPLFVVHRISKKPLILNLSAARKEATLFDIGFLICKITSVKYFLFDSMNSIYVDI